MSKYKREVNVLLQESKNGDKKSFQTLYRFTYKKLLLVATHYLFDKTELEDVVEESYLKIHKSLDTVDPEKDGYNWMCKTVQTKAYLFNEKRRKRAEISIEELTRSKEEKYTSVFAYADEVIERSDLLNALKRLTETKQEIVYYRYWEELTYEEIAKRLGMAKTTVYDQMKAIKRELGKYLRGIKEI